ncbi:MAG: pirin family protein [Deltaproteobacteria bacterium]|nr:pirin family protein [Deltaproteobacteria bacterium]
MIPEAKKDRPDPILLLERLTTPWQTDDPFLFCVHHLDHYPAGNAQLGPAAPLGGRRIGMDFDGRDGWNMYHGEIVPGFPQHPHRGFETVTVTRQGLVDHADSLGAGARYGEGDVQWLTAGKGIVHAEMFPLLSAEAPNPLELFQIWLNLPMARKMVAPYFSMFWAPTVPRVVVKDAAGRITEVVVVAGRFGEVAPPSPPPDSWASQEGAEVGIWTLKLEPGARFELPATAPGANRSLYYFAGGGLRLDGRELPLKHRARLRAGQSVTLEAGEATAECLVLQGHPIGEPTVQYGPFVMNSREEIARAFEDYRATGFGGWPWDRDDPIHGEARERFARHPDGREERPA